MTANPYDCLPFEEACARLGLPPSTMESLLAEHRGPRVFKIGRRRFIHHEDMNAWLRSLASHSK